MEEQYEIEIKSLLGKQENAEKLLTRMKEQDPNMQQINENKQLNHYFKEGNLQNLYEHIKEHLNEQQQKSLQAFVNKANNFSVRTRWANGTVILVIKATVDDTTSENGTARREWEHTMNMTLEELDQLVLESGFSYQAKWSRERQEYSYKGINTTIDKNAGYGYLAEFEKIVPTTKALEEEKQALRTLLKELELEELNHERLERMFQHYNNNWEEYYGTNKTFTIH